MNLPDWVAKCQSHHVKVQPKLGENSEAPRQYDKVPEALHEMIGGVPSPAWVTLPCVFSMKFLTSLLV